MQIISNVTPHHRGLIPLYRTGEQNRCPGCSHEHWIVGRMMAECGFCGTALPLEQFSTYSASPRFEHSGTRMPELPDYLQVVS